MPLLSAKCPRPHQRRIGEPFKGTVVPFGAMVEYHPIGLHQFGKKVSPGISSEVYCSRWEFGKEK